MAQEAATDLEHRLAQAQRELSESLERQAATDEVLRVISSSPGALQPVFETILAHATRICAAKFGMLNLYDGESFDTVAFHNAPPEYVDARSGRAFRPNRESGLGYVERTRQVAHIEDVRARRVYLDGGGSRSCRPRRCPHAAHRSDAQGGQASAPSAFAARRCAPSPTSRSIC
jgi:hypothetical protein